MDPFLRQRLLPEIGDEGQRRLERHRVAPMNGPDGRVRDMYLRRAGVIVDTDLDSVSGSSLASLAGNPALQPSAAVLAGAFEAVEELKRALNVGKPGSLDGFCLCAAQESHR